MRVSQADRVKSIMVPFEPSGPKPLGHDVNLRKTTRTLSSEGFRTNRFDFVLR